MTVEEAMKKYKQEHPSHRFLTKLTDYSFKVDLPLEPQKEPKSFVVMLSYMLDFR